MPTITTAGLALCLLLPSSDAVAEPLESFKDCDTCPEMVELPVGTFVMSAAPDELRRMLPKIDYDDPSNPYRKDDEGPQRTVTVDLPFAMSRNEVTYNEWMACVADGGCNGYVPKGRVHKDGPDPVKVEVKGEYPVFFVSWFDAVAYTDWLNRKTGTTAYRLPTEAEWEYAARAGTQTTFPQGESVTTDQANFSKQMTEFVMLERLPDVMERHVPVKVSEMDAANAWGLRHMTGNASELTSSCYSKSLPDWSLTSEWFDASKEDCTKRVERGGSWQDSIINLRSAWRSPTPTDSRTGSGGFRVTKTLEQSVRQE